MECKESSVRKVLFSFPALPPPSPSLPSFLFPPRSVSPSLSSWCPRRVARQYVAMHYLNYILKPNAKGAQVSGASGAATLSTCCG